MRLFVAIDLDEGARRAIGAEQRRVREALGAGRSLRWVKPADMHLTLVFVGEVEAPRGADVAETMRSPVAARPFAASFAGLGVFPRRGAPSVLWLGVRHGSAELIAVQKAIADRLEGIGIMREPRPYQPHLTLARWRMRAAEDQSDRRRIAAADRDVEVARVHVDSVALYESQLSSGGPQYSMLTRALLQS